MRIVPLKHQSHRALSLSLAVLLLLTIYPRPTSEAQNFKDGRSEAAAHDGSEDAPLFRLDTAPVGEHAELLTVYGSLNGLRSNEGAGSDVPLVSILRDTLGDERTENDRLRYVWMLTYTRPSIKQRIASAVPFLYTTVGGKKRASTKGMPPPVIDLAAPERDVWERFLWVALQNVVFNPYGALAKSSSSAMRRNSTRYRQAHILRALAVLSLYEAESGTKSAFTTSEMNEIQGRLMLADKTFGGMIDDAYLERARREHHTQWLDTRGHNWELLRQRVEAEGLYFEPLEMPGGEATHALVWIAREDIERNRERKFNGRFLNIKNPWRDGRLRRWDGHTETWHLDSSNRSVSPDAEGARAVEMIPLALFGLDHPKIPSLLIDFRDTGNPKRREMSHRVLEDITRNLLALSRFGDVHYFLGRTVYDFVTNRRGMDINQPSRVRAYSQLKLLLSLDATLDRDLKEEIEQRIESVSLNPLENDLEAEARIARQQHAALMEYARRPDGLPARLERERREELVPVKHNRASRVLFRFANILSLGLYKHREGGARADIHAALDRKRSLNHHKRFLMEVARTAPIVEVVWDIEEVRRSLRYVAAAGGRADSSTARAAARIFAQTADAETRRLCLNCLYQINDETARKELLRIYQMPDISQELRLQTARHLRDALREDKGIAPEDVRAIISVIGQ